MTRDEQRATIIFETAKRVKKLRLAREPGMDRIAILLNCEPTGRELAEAEIWLDAQHGLAHLTPIEAMEEMFDAIPWLGQQRRYDLKADYKRMSAAGDLTNPPKG